MSSNSDAGDNLPRAEPDPSGTWNDSKPTRRTAGTHASTFSDSIPSPDMSDPPRICTRKDSEDISQSVVRSGNTSLFSDDGAVDQDEMIITSIRAVDVALGLRRLPMGFYATVHHSGHEWRTENKHSSVNFDFVEWISPIPIPSDLSTTVHFRVYASFEFQPMLGTGELLRMFTVTVKQLLDCSAEDASITFSPKNGDVVSPCSSISVTVEQQMYPPLSRVLLPNPNCSPPESPEELEHTTNEGHAILSYYRKEGGKQYLELSVAKFERAYSLCPLDHPCRAAAQSNLAMAKFILCQVEGTNTSLESPLTLYRDALRARPIGHIDRPTTLIQLAAVSLAQHDKPSNEVEGAKALLQEALELSSRESHENRAAVVMLRCTAHWVDPTERDVQSSVERHSSSGLTDQDPWIASVALLKRYQRFGELDDLKRTIVITRDLIQTTPVSDDNYPRGLSNLGVALWYRFNRFRELPDLADSISTLRSAVQFTADGHPDKHSDLNNLGISLLTQFEHLGEVGDLNDAVSTLRDAVQRTPDAHPDKPRRLTNLGIALLARFSRIGELGDMENAISIQRDAVRLTPTGHPNRPGRLNSLGNSLRTRFSRLGEPGDLDDAISTLRDAVQLFPNGHPNKPSCLRSLGVSLDTRFERLGELRDLDEAISTQRDVVQLTPDANPDKPHRLGSLGFSLYSRFERLGELGDLDGAISAQRNAVRLTPFGHPNRPGRLNNIGSSILTRFSHLGEPGDLNDAISILKDAVQLTPDGHPDKPSNLNSLGNSLRTRFERLGELADLDDAVSTQRDAVQLTPASHPDKPCNLSNFGVSLWTRFERLGELADLDNAISTQRLAVNLIRNGHPNMPSCLNNLCLSLYSRFNHLGELSDINEAISTQRDAIQLTNEGHPGRPSFLNNLGNFLLGRFSRLGELGDLDEAISTQRDAVRLTPAGHPDKPGGLNNLGNSLRTRFSRLKELGDLDDAILTQRDAIQILTDGHRNKPGCLSNLGSSLLTRFECLGELGDMDNAIVVQRNAVQLTPADHPDKVVGLNNLGVTLLTRFERLGELGNLDDAISALKDAVQLTPDSHSDKPSCLSNLGDSLLARFSCLSELRDLEGALSAYAIAAFLPLGSVRIRFRASQRWIFCARRIRHHSLLRAYSVAISLLPQLAWIGLSLEHRYSELKQGADLVREAAAAALDAELPELAVEWLERGRSIVWGEQFRLRGSYEELESVHQDHARRLQELSMALDHASASREKSLSVLSFGTGGVVADCMPESLRQEADRQRALAIERDNLLKEIRRLPGFRQFLLGKDFSQLCASAHVGPVVILNATETRCDALVVLPNVDRVVHVPLPKFSSQRSISLQNTLKTLIRREGQPMKLEGPDWGMVLCPLWKSVVKPVLDALAFSIPGGLSRIFWCPTGPFTFLPFHAAGLYDEEHSQLGHKVFDFVVSSYTPSLAILSPLPNSAAAQSDQSRFLVVRQPATDGQLQLPGVVTELAYIREVIENLPRTTLVEPLVGTVEEVLSLMKDADWVHFACHGVQDGIDSGMCLADGRRLKIRDIVALSRARRGLAFLSACQTATGDKQLSDEAIHIAAGMLFAGYGGVIGTMWSISDALAPVVAKNVYRHLFREGTRLNYLEAAYALHEAIGDLRGGVGASFDEWIPFVHVGL